MQVQGRQRACCQLWARWLRSREGEREGPRHGLTNGGYPDSTIEGLLRIPKRLPVGLMESSFQSATAAAAGQRTPSWVGVMVVGNSRRAQAQVLV